jgi:two-component system, NtrC family, C4-dicarboxylate transport response regulator DctD
LPDHLRVLLVEDDDAVRFSAAQALRLAGLEVNTFETASAVRPQLHPFFPGVLVSDVKLHGGMDGLELLDYALGVDPSVPVILITGHGDIAMAVQAMRKGAYDFIEKPFASDYLVGAVQRALEKRSLTLEVQELRRKLEDRKGIGQVLIGHSPPIEELRRTILSLSDTPVDVLINGETGSGKELVAQCLHQVSPSRRGHFVAINCGAIPETVFESEAFGHEAGAFTGAQRRRIGKLEYATGGTLFLDEIESMPLSMQVKLLRALQERKIERLGSNELIEVNLRIIAATKVDLKELSDRGDFRSDLYYRLNVVTLDVPPLRERREDIPLLFEHFLLEASARFGRQAPLASSQFIRELMTYAWPGNVRELRNVADRFLLRVLGKPFTTDAETNSAVKALGDQVDEFERSLIIDELRRQHGNVSAAAEELAVPKKTLYDKLRKYAIAPEGFR